MLDFHWTRRVEFADTDAAGIIHFSSYFRYMEETEHALFRSLGTSIHRGRGPAVRGQVEEDGEPVWPRVHASCDYLAPVYFEDVLDIRLRVEELRRRSVVYAFEIARGATPVARGRIKTTCCTFADGKLKSRDIPAWLAEKLKELRVES